MDQPPRRPGAPLHRPHGRGHRRGLRHRRRHRRTPGRGGSRRRARRRGAGARHGGGRTDHARTAAGPGSCGPTWRREDDWRRIVAAAHGFGPVDVLVSNAFTVDVAPAHELTLESWQRQLSVNVTAGFLGFRAVLPDLRARRGAAVLTSSVHARMGIPGHPAYAASKGALLSLCGQLAVEYGPEVRVNAVLPGPDPHRRVGPGAARGTRGQRRRDGGPPLRYPRGGGRGHRLPERGRSLLHHRHEPRRGRRLERREGLGMTSAAVLAPQPKAVPPLQQKGGTT